MAGARGGDHAVVAVGVDVPVNASPLDAFFGERDAVQGWLDGIATETKACRPPPPSHTHRLTRTPRPCMYAVNV